MEFMLTTVRLLALDEALLYKLGDDSLAGKSQKTCSVRGGGRARLSTKTRIITAEPGWSL
jgi:hypothetical protein